MPPPTGTRMTRLSADVVVPARRDLRGLRDDLVHRRIDEALELNLADRFESAERHADRLPDDGGLGQDRVANPTFAEAFLQALRHPEHAAETADVLTDEHDRLVAVHQFMQRAVD